MVAQICRDVLYVQCLSSGGGDVDADAPATNRGALNLAILFAVRRHRVIIVDAEFPPPTFASSPSHLTVPSHHGNTPEE